MRVLVLGSGGREHALAKFLAQSPHVSHVLCAPGNAGTDEVGENVSGDLSKLDSMVALAKERNVDLTIVGPEAPLCAGIVDRFQAAGLSIFGPTAAAARIEGDKAYAKRLMKRAHVPTAEARIFDRYNEARDYVATRDAGVVVKASGLAAGKGVVVCPEPAEALVALEQIMLHRQFGDAGGTVVVEEILRGQELSIHAFVDDRTIYVLDSAQDHKAVGDGDVGPNTGGMGAYSPAPIATDDVLRIVEREVLVPIVDALRGEGSPYRGVLYAGLMLTPAGPKVLEFNCRFGDPETQVLLSRLDCDVFELLSAVVDGRLDQAEVRWKSDSAVCVVMASGGYPGDYQRGKRIEGLDRASALPGVHVFHAGTRRQGSEVASSGGRVLAVTALGSTIADAKLRAYEAVDMIHFEKAFCRRDIADKAMNAAGSLK
ncbi:MAG: phosphoribosylamine--glycine ligase [Planctomycetota bacterium]